MKIPLLVSFFTQFSTYVYYGTGSTKSHAAVRAILNSANFHESFFATHPIPHTRAAGVLVQKLENGLNCYCLLLLLNLWLAFLKASSSVKMNELHSYKFTTC